MNDIELKKKLGLKIKQYRNNLNITQEHLAEKINFAVDGIVAVIMGITVAVTALKTVISQTKYLINN